jgi:magnesium-transporting ATPase (P-type)
MLTHRNVQKTAKTDDDRRIIALVPSSDIHVVSQKEANNLILQITIVALALSVMVFMLIALHAMDTSQAMHVIVASLLITIPESLLVGLPVIVILYIRRMRSHNIPVSSTQAINDIGNATNIILSSKDTLINKSLETTAAWSLAGQSADTLAYTAKAINQMGGKHDDSFDEALSHYAAAHAIKVPSQQPIESFTFDHATGLSGNLWHHGSHFELVIKGTPEKVINQADLSEGEREKIEAMVHKLTAEGGVIIAVAHQERTRHITHLKDLKRTDRLTFDGLIIMKEVLQPQARVTASVALSSGIGVGMITGGHIEAAYYTGKQLGIIDNRDAVIDARHMATYTHVRKDKMTGSVKITSHTTPEATLDAIALLSGSASQIPLAHDFEGAIDSIITGRRLFNNIRQILIYLLTISSAEMLILFGAIIGGISIPFLSVQILWVNFVISTIVAIALGLRKERIPARPAAPAKLLSQHMLSRIAIIVVAMAGLTLVVYTIFDTFYGRSYAQTIALSALITMQWVSVYYLTSASRSTIRDYQLNIPLHVGLLITILLQLLVICSPLGGLILHTTYVTASDLFVSSFGVTLFLMLLLEAHDELRRISQSTNPSIQLK